MYSIFTTEYLPQNTLNERTLKNNSSSRINFTNNGQVTFQTNSFKLTGTHFSKKEKGGYFNSSGTNQKARLFLLRQS